MNAFQLSLILYIYQETLTAIVLLSLLTISFALLIVAIARNMEVNKIG